MRETGRLSKSLHPIASQIVFDPDMQRAIHHDLPFMVKIDRAQLVMLTHCGFLPAGLASDIVTLLDDTEDSGFAELADITPLRGTFLAYENYLTAKLGDEVGNLHLGRSRNDINATMAKLSMRETTSQTVVLVSQLIDSLCAAGNRQTETPMVLHTHRQPALPSTLGHYYAGFAAALSRDLTGLIDSLHDLKTSPLGAGAGGGTTLAIEPELTAKLLGFEGAALNSIDAVASRDLVLRCLSALAILGSTLSRLAETLLIWLGDGEWARLPDDLVGSSSAMPHKRNAFLLEHVQGKAGALSGALMTALSSAHAAPFTNCVAVGTEAIKPLGQALSTANDMVELMRLTIEGLEVVPDRIAEAQRAGFVNAMEIATQLAVSDDIGFRQAHAKVGKLVNDAIEQGHREILKTAQASECAALDIASPALLAAGIVRAADRGGGPAPVSVRKSLAQSAKTAARAMTLIKAQQLAWRQADALLHRACQRLVDERNHPNQTNPLGDLL